MPPLPPAALALEQLLARLRSINSALLTLESYARWGVQNNDDAARASAEGNRLFPDQSRTARALTEHVAALRRDQPAALAAWVDAHQALLRAFVDAHADDPERSTACSIARDEIAAWEGVRSGERAYVEANVGWVHVDLARYTADFGLAWLPGPHSEL